MMNLKEKIKILKDMETNNFDYKKIPEFLSLSRINGLFKPIITAIINNLIILDTHISAVYDLVPDEEWKSYFTDSDVPIVCSAEDDEIFEKIKILISNFPVLYEYLNNDDIPTEDIIDILQEIFNNKTRNIQFLLFKIAKKRPKHIFGYLMAKLRKFPKIYTPFFCSLLVRLKLDDVDFKIRCVKIYFNHVYNLKLEKNIDTALMIQFLIYILCFNQNYYYDIDGIKPFIDEVFESSLTSIMNKDIINMFCKIFNYKVKPFENNLMECMYYFPFDAPVCPSIYESIEDDFIHFA